jgi:hypothetical protein
MIFTHIKRTITPIKAITNVNAVPPLSFKKAEIHMAMEYGIVVTNNLTFDMYGELNLDADAVWFHATTSDHHLMFIFVQPVANKN